MKNIIKLVAITGVFVMLSFVSKNNDKLKVVIDAGHGGHDAGFVTNELQEKQITQQIADKIKNLSGNDVEIILTRSQDDFLSLQERVSLINEMKPDLVISLHINGNKNESAKGFEIFISKEEEKQKNVKPLAEKLSTTIQNNTSLKNRGINTAPFFILKKSECPSILLEMGFLSNAEDKEVLTSEAGQNTMAQSISNFISDLK